MKINEIITEAGWTSEEYALAEMMSDRIIKDCHPFLSQLTDPKTERLWRGMNDRPQVGKIHAHLNDRRPADTKVNIHSDMNVWFQDNFKYPWRNGTFVVSDPGIARHYGEVYAIFPIGKFEFLWSTSIADVYTEISDISDYNVKGRWVSTFDKLHKNEPEELNLPDKTKINKMSVYDVLDDIGEFSTTDLSAAMKSDHEITLWCEQYYYVKRGLESFLQL